MGRNAPSGFRPGPVPPTTYWRRRVVALAVGIGMLGLGAWAANGALAAPAPPGEARGVSATASSHAGRAHSAAEVNTAVSGSTPSARPKPTGSAGSTTPSPKPSPARRPRAHDAHMPAPCPARDVVLSLISPRYWYKSGQQPEFTVYVVSTATRQCSFNVGSTHVSVVVSTGRTRIWSSADCPSGAVSRLVALTRGVPRVLDIKWDRKTSSPGCKLRRRNVKPGAFTATAASGRLRSAPKIFVLGAAGLAVP